MKSCLKPALIASAFFFALGAFPTEEASAQGPIIRGMRERFNGGKPLLPFVVDPEASKPKPALRPKPEAKRPTPATKKRPTPAAKTPTPATKTPTPAYPGTQERPKIKLQTPSDRAEAANPQALGAKGFGMQLQKQGDYFFVGQIDPRGNAAEAGLRRGDLVEEIGGAPIKVVEEFEAIAKAMRGGDRVEFKVSRRGSKAQKINVQFGEIEPESDEPNRIEIAPADSPTPAATRRRMTDRYEPPVGGGLRSIYEGAEEPSSILEPTPAPARSNRVESLGELDFPALDGGK